MTAQDTQRIEPPVRGPGASRVASTRSSGKAYDRRIRRQEQIRGTRLTRTGSPIAAALTRVPFVALVLLLLSGGVVGVLYLNTISDAAGLRASQSRLAQMNISTAIEAQQKAIAAMKDPAHLAAQATALGLVPGGDAAIITIGADGKSTVIGTPTVVAGPAPTAPPEPAPTAAAAVPASVSAAAAPAAPTTAVPKLAAPNTAAPATAAPKATAPQVAAPEPAVPKASAAEVAATEAAAAKAAAAKAAAAKAAAKPSTPKPTALKPTALKPTALKPAAPKPAAPKTAGAGR